MNPNLDEKAPELAIFWALAGKCIIFMLIFKRKEY